MDNLHPADPLADDVDHIRDAVFRIELQLGSTVGLMHQITRSQEVILEALYALINHEIENGRVGAQTQVGLTTSRAARQAVRQATPSPSPPQANLSQASPPHHV